MDLGQPHEIQSAEMYDNTAEEKEKALERVNQGLQARRNTKIMLTEALYNAHKLDGMSDKEIAPIYGIVPRTIVSYRSLWRKGEKI